MAETLGQVVGRNIERIRRGRSQDDVVRELRLVGVEWSRSNFTAYAQGRRSIGLEELLLLAAVLHVAAAELLAGDGDVDLAGRVVPLAAIRDELAGRRRPELAPPGERRAAELLASGVVGRAMRTPHQLSRAVLRASDERREVAMTYAGEAEERAARKFGVAVEDVALASIEAWGKTLSEERDDRIRAELEAEQPGVSQSPLTVPMEGGKPEARWWADGVERLARRRKVMSERLLDELAPTLEQIATSRKKA